MTGMVAYFLWMILLESVTLMRVRKDTKEGKLVYMIGSSSFSSTELDDAFSDSTEAWLEHIYSLSWTVGNGVPLVSDSFTHTYIVNAGPNQMGLWLV